MDPQERSAQHALHRRPRTRLPGPPTNRAATTCPARTPWRVTKRPLDRRTPRWLTAVMSETAITGIHHVTLSVSDLDRTVEWYVGVLGFEEFRRLTHKRARQGDGPA